MRLLKVVQPPICCCQCVLLIRKLRVFACSRVRFHVIRCDCSMVLSCSASWHSWAVCQSKVSPLCPLLHSPPSHRVIAWEVGGYRTRDRKHMISDVCIFVMHRYVHPYLHACLQPLRRSSRGCTSIRPVRLQVQICLIYTCSPMGGRYIWNQRIMAISPIDSWGLKPSKSRARDSRILISQVLE